MAEAPGPAYVHEVRVRYGEVDLQGAVFNAHYLAYCDDAVETWLRSLDTNFAAHGWDFMLKRAEVVWQGSAGLGDTITIAVGVTRWGTTSFDVGFAGRVGDRPVFDATITYVGVRHGTTEPVPPPDEVRSRLGEARSVST